MLGVRMEILLYIYSEPTVQMGINISPRSTVNKFEIGECRII